jgi:hypothetical protein
MYQYKQINKMKKNILKYREMNIREFYKDYVRSSKSELGKKYYDDQIDKLLLFRKYATLGDITENFIIDFYNYMVKELHNKESTADKSLIFLKSIINEAIKLGYITENPFRHIHIKMPRNIKNRKYIPKVPIVLT